MIMWGCNMETILSELRKPFHPSVIEWKPGATTSDKKRCMAMAYADPRAYMNRLDEVCGMGWSVTYTAWGDKIVCHLTIDGVTRSSTGEPDSQSERSEIAGTAAEGQAFKRACAMFGLGRYLYNLPSTWVEYDAERRQISDQGKAKLSAIVNSHYRRAMDGQPEAEQQAEGDGGNLSTIVDTDTLRQQFDDLGKDLYGKGWSQVCRHNVERISGGQTTDAGQLNTEQVQKLINGLHLLKAKRQAQPAGK
jgi:hypothetical protein